MNLSKITRIFVIILVPFFLIMTAVRLMISPLFVEFEYKAPGFPADEYGFTQEERLKWAKISVDYLLNNQGIEFLGNQMLDSKTPLYNERELSHMLDVKNLIQAMIVAWYAIGAILILLGVWAHFKKWAKDFWSGISVGGLATLILLGVAFVAILTAFDWLFTEFHHLFFTGDTWLFYYTDTLIRLFPMRLWQDAFIFVGILSAIFGLLFLTLGSRLQRRIQ
ncbi:MAG: TIGR01906 family membrane protein [Anaerolineaceae bacterium]|nr:TIGR01906 family membrane protein [Anaerolineaceae bacterium]NTV36993.1 TIGR01906 family membrane protein [Anaerolineaceae bacterium]